MNLPAAIRTDWPNWARMVVGAIIVLSGWFILDLRHSAEVNSAVSVRLASSEREIDNLRTAVTSLSIDGASIHSSISQLNGTLKQIHDDMQIRTQALTELGASIDEIHRTVEIGATGQANNLREVSRIINELGRQICSQQQCNHLQSEIDKKK